MVQDASYLKECYPTLGGETPCQRIGGTRLLRFLALLVHKGRAKQQELRAARYAPLPTHAVSRPTLSVAFGLSLTTLSAGLALSHCQSYRMTGFLSACRLDCSINPHLRACRSGPCFGAMVACGSGVRVVEELPLLIAATSAGTGTTCISSAERTYPALTPKKTQPA